MFEYAISCGEGTLLDYGVADELDGIKAPDGFDLFFSDYGGGSFFEPEATVILGPASPDCQTGK